MIHSLIIIKNCKKSLKSQYCMNFVIFNTDKRGEKHLNLVQQKQAVWVSQLKRENNVSVSDIPGLNAGLSVDTVFLKHCAHDWKKRNSSGWPPEAFFKINFLLTQSLTMHHSQRALYCWLWVYLKYTCNCWLYKTHRGPHWMKGKL